MNNEVIPTFPSYSSGPGTFDRNRYEQERRAERERIDKAVAKRNADLAEAKRKRQADIRAEGEAALESFRVESLNRWTANGGTESEFIRNWSNLKTEYLTRRLTDHESKIAELTERALQSGQYGRW